MTGSVFPPVAARRQHREWAPEQQGKIAPNHDDQGPTAQGAPVRPVTEGDGRDHGDVEDPGGCQPSEEPEQRGNDAGDPPTADAFAPGAYQTHGEETETELDNAQRVDVEVAADGALFQLAITKL